MLSKPYEIIRAARRNRRLGSQIDHGKTQMFGWFELKSPLTAEQRRWIETRFAWLRKEFGEERLRGVVVTPTHEFFPDRYCATEEDTTVLLDRLCGYMDVDRSRIDLQLYTSPSADDVVTAFNPLLRREFALGAFQQEDGRIVIWLEKTRLDEPHSVVSTLTSARSRTSWGTSSCWLTDDATRTRQTTSR